MALALIRPTKGKARCATYAGWRCAYPAYERQSTVRSLCRMALRLSGLQNNAYPAYKTARSA